MLSARKIQYSARRINSKFISGEVKREMPGKQKQHDLIPVMDYGQYRRAKKLVHESENRKYYYMKLKENFFTTEKMVILESAQDGLLYSNLLLKMYLMSLKHSGILMLGDGLPHTPQTIATFTRHQISTVERALKLFTEFGFVEVLTDGAYYMADIQLLIGQSSTEGERKKKERMRLKRQNLLPSGQEDICPPEIRY